MAELFNRKDDKLSIAGGIEVKIPTNVSALAILSGNRDIQNGDEFRNDGYVYRDDKILRKYWLPRDGWNHFWEPLLDQIPRIERLWHTNLQRSKKHYVKLAALAEDVLAQAPLLKNVWPEYAKKKPWRQDAKVVFAKATHDYKCSQDTDKIWWMYLFAGPDDQFNRDNKWAHSWSFEWIYPEDKMPDTCPVKTELGQRFYHLEHTQRPHWNGHLTNLLDEAIGRYIRYKMKEHHPTPTQSRIICLTINGRTFWYNTYWEHQYLHTKILTWPENTTAFQEIKE